MRVTVSSTSQVIFRPARLEASAFAWFASSRPGTMRHPSFGRRSKERTSMGVLMEESSADVAASGGKHEFPPVKTKNA